MYFNRQGVLGLRAVVSNNLNKWILSLILTSLIIPLAIDFPPLLAEMSSTSTRIPDYTSVAVELVSENIGPLAPGLVKPGGCINVTLRVELGSISGAYAWMISDINGSLRLNNYTLTTRIYNNRLVELCSPSNTIDGVYDIVIKADRDYVIPRSLWVLSSIPSKLRVVVFSDLHIETGSPTPREGDINRFSASVIAHWVNPDLVIFAGDITDTASESESQIAQTYRYIYLYKYPVLSVPGNHDWPSTTYAKYLGPLRWVRVIGEKLLVIGIFTVPYAGVEGIITPEEIAFLEEALVNYSHIPIKIIVFHYPMFYYQGELITRYDDEELLKPYAPGVNTPVSSYWSPNMTAFRYVLKLIEDYNVTAVISGHIHRDLFVKYTSTRTNTTTYFMTFTSTAHSVPLYNGIGVFDVNLETGEITFPLQPPGFTGFTNVTPPSAKNSLPLGVLPGTYITPIRVFHSANGYKAIFENRYSWYSNLSARLLWAFPWPINSQLVLSTNTTGNATLHLIDKLSIGNRLFTLVDLKLPYSSTAEISLYTISDVSPPLIELYRSIPETPRLNSTLTIYFNIRDFEWGVNIEYVSVEFNGTSVSVQVIRPTSYIDWCNNASLKVDLYVRGVNTTVTLLRVITSDLSGKVSEKLYRIIFTAPGITPSEPPISEIKVEEKPTPSPSPTPPSPSPSPTPTLSPSPREGVGLFTSVIILIIVIVFVVIAATIYFLRARK
jgi:Icc-related predicted phosphoesterase